MSFNKIDILSVMSKQMAGACEPIQELVEWSWLCDGRPPGKLADHVIEGCRSLGGAINRSIERI